MCSGTGSIPHGRQRPCYTITPAEAGCRRYGMDRSHLDGSHQRDRNSDRYDSYSGIQCHGADTANLDPGSDYTFTTQPVPKNNIIIVKMYEVAIVGSGNGVAYWFEAPTNGVDGTCD